MAVTELWPTAIDGPPGVGTQIGVKRNRSRTLFAGVPAAASIRHASKPPGAADLPDRPMRRGALAHLGQGTPSFTNALQTGHTSAVTARGHVLRMRRKLTPPSAPGSRSALPRPCVRALADTLAGAAAWPSAAHRSSTHSARAAAWGTAALGGAMHLLQRTAAALSVARTHPLSLLLLPLCFQDSCACAPL